MDLQLKTITQFLKKELASISNNILDIGAGNAPWKCFLSPNIHYVGLDIKTAADNFNMKPNHDIVYYTGEYFPFPETSFSYALCIEVLEHIYNTDLFLSEIYRILKPNGKLLLTIPWSARRHHLPHDYFRFTPEAMQHLFKSKGFIDIKITPRGNTVCVLFNKLLFLILNLLYPKRKYLFPITLPLAIIFLPSLLVFFIFSHLSIYLGIQSALDPLGFSLTARKPAVQQ